MHMTKIYLTLTATHYDERHTLKYKTWFCKNEIRFEITKVFSTLLGISHFVLDHITVEFDHISWNKNKNSRVAIKLVLLQNKRKWMRRIVQQWIPEIMCIGENAFSSLSTIHPENYILIFFRHYMIKR